MIGSVSRLAPPLSRHGPELDWVLARAFGPAGATSKASPDVSFRQAHALDLCRGLGLGGRIAGRTPADLLERELGREGQRALAFERLRLLGTNRELSDAARRVREVAQPLGINPLWLKFAALSARGFVEPGDREARDVDLLATEPEGVALHAALVRAGFRAVPGPSAAHQLPALVADSGAAVEIHRCIWGVSVSGGASTLEDLLQHDAVTSLPDGTATLRDDLLAAHALVHGLVQHRSRPKEYAPFRALADLIDLQAWRFSQARIHAAIAGLLSQADIASATELARALRHGTPSAHLAERDQALLANLLAASLDADFQSALGVERVFELLREGSLSNAVRRTFVEPRADEGEPTDARSSHPNASSLAEPLGRALELVQGCAGYLRLAWRSSRFGR